jgi:hypothetical protein
MIRPLHPTDVPSYMVFASKACAGDGPQACEPGEPAARLLRVLGRSLPLDVPQHTWVYTENRKIRGLVSVRSRRGAAVWQVERLLGLPGEEMDYVLEDLLLHLAAVGAEEGIQKLFLSLPSSSQLLPTARRAGFYSYTVERLYRGSARGDFPLADAPRPRRGLDNLALFEHYNRAVPLRVRQAEALTLQEWRWLDGWTPGRHWRLSVSRTRQDYLLDRNGRIDAWLQIEPSRHVARVSLEETQVSQQQAGELLAFAIARLPTAGWVYVPARAYEIGLESSLQQLGFAQVGDSTLMVKPLSVRVPDRCLVPARA